LGTFAKISGFLERSGLGDPSLRLLDHGQFIQIVEGVEGYTKLSLMRVKL